MFGQKIIKEHLVAFLMVAYYKDILLIAFLATKTNAGKGRVVHLSLVTHPYLTKVGNPDKMFRHLPLQNLRESLYQLRLTYFFLEGIAFLLRC